MSAPLRVALIVLVAGCASSPPPPAPAPPPVASAPTPVSPPIPKAGDTCSAGQQVCLDPSSAVFCGPDGKYLAMSCNGTGNGGGCKGAGATFDCDNSVAAPGDGCSQPEDAACTADHKAALECGPDHTFTLGETCKGEKGCTITAAAISCDNDTSDPGDPCHFAGDYACTPDKLLVLRCEDHKMTPLNSCRGPTQCRVIPKPQDRKVQFDCDDSLAVEADPCDTNGEEACSTDAKSMFVCKEHRFTSPVACPGPKGCTHDVKTDAFKCDKGRHAATTHAPSR
jgi:hypothetical protein